MRHVVSIEEDARGFQAVCSCNKYYSRWQQYRGVAVQLGRIHVDRKADSEAARGTR